MQETSEHTSDPACDKIRRHEKSGKAKQEYDLHHTRQVTGANMTTDATIIFRRCMTLDAS